MSEPHIHYKSLLKRIYNHAGCTKYRNYFTVSLKMINVIDKKQMYHNVITGNENVSEEWNSITSVFLTSFRLMSILCLVMYISYVFALKLLSGFFWEKVWFFL